MTTLARHAALVSGYRVAVVVTDPAPVGVHDLLFDLLGLARIFRHVLPQHAFLARGSRLQRPGQDGLRDPLAALGLP